MTTEKSSEDHVQSFGDFTEDEYRELIAQAKKHWRFVGFPEHAQTGRTILWRHDVDFSVHRARALARIEYEAGVQATYFILLGGSFYNPLEKDVAKIIGDIAGLGHTIGLHFDPARDGEELASREKLEEELIFECKILGKALGIFPTAFSWHNPTSGNWLTMEDEFIGGVLNAYCRAISSRYRYVSDSNGVWRHARLPDVLKDTSIENLQVLTHPAWWVPAPLPPRERIERAVDGRLRGAIARYDERSKRYDGAND